MRLTSLFHEFKEGNVGDYQSELDLLGKTIVFYNLTKQRLMRELAGVNKFMRYHFRKRWKIERDLYAVAIETNMEYLKMILRDHKEDYYLYLRRATSRRNKKRN